MAVTARVRVEPRHTERRDTWWVEPVLIVLALGGFVVYAAIVAFSGVNYWADPYLSPFYSPCLAAQCPEHILGISIGWWTLSPALLTIGSPLAFRTTCYYFRRAYYRSFFSSPPGCAVPDLRKRYSGESRFPFILQNIHRYTLYVVAVSIAIDWWDVIKAYDFPAADGTRHLGIGLGSLVMTAEVLLLSAYVFGCHAARYLVGGYLDSFHRASLRLKLWSAVTRLNLHHMLWAWVSLVGVAATDLYIRLVAVGVIVDPRILF